MQEKYAVSLDELQIQRDELERLVARVRLARALVVVHGELDVVIVVCVVIAAASAAAAVVIATAVVVVVVGVGVVCSAAAVGC